VIHALLGALGVNELIAHPFLWRAFSPAAPSVSWPACRLLPRAARQVFTGDALGHVAFTGAAAALAFGIDARVGLVVATVGLGVAMGLLGERGRADDIVIGNVLAWVLGLGVLFLSIFVSSASAGNGSAGVSVLFGSVFG